MPAGVKCLILVIVALILILPLTARASQTRGTPPTAVYAAIHQVFGKYTEQALTVSWCESRFRPWASNGQYLGLFQMGSAERRRFGHGRSPLTQAKAAWLYFVLSGKDWSPWSCKP